MTFQSVEPEVRRDETAGQVLLPIPVYLAEGPPGASYICKPDWNKITGAGVFVGVAAVNLPSAIGGRRCSPDRHSRVDWLELILASN